MSVKIAKITLVLNEEEYLALMDECRINLSGAHIVNNVDMAPIFDQILYQLEELARPEYSDGPPRQIEKEFKDNHYE